MVRVPVIAFQLGAYTPVKKTGKTFFYRSSDLKKLQNGLRNIIFWSKQVLIILIQLQL